MVWIGCAISTLVMVVFVYKFDMGKVRDSLMLVQWWSMALAGVVFICSYMIRGLRWKLLLHPLRVLRWGQVWEVLMVGFMLNNTLPARAGELARPLLLWKLHGTSRRGGLATVGVERIFDGFCIVSMLSLVALAFEVPSEIRHTGHVVTAIMVAGLVVVVWLAFRPASFFNVVRDFLFFLPERFREKVVGFFQRFVEGTHALRDAGLVLRVGLLTVVVWVLEVVVYLTVMRGIGIQLPPWCAVIVLAAINFSIAVPSAPAYIGVYEAACGGAVVLLSSMLSYPMTWELALSYSISVHLLLVVCIVGPGLALMWRLGLRFSDLTGRCSRRRGF